MARILLGVTGSIAAHRALDLASELTKAGDQVDVLLSPGALRFVQPLAFQAISRRAVHADLWTPPSDDAHDHIRMAQHADLFVVAPCSADAIGKFASGICDEIVSTTMIAFEGRRLLCPAMNWRMWANPIVKHNVATLRSFGFEFVGPAEGDLACGEKGPGRLAPVAEILARIRG